MRSVPILILLPMLATAASAFAAGPAPEIERPVAPPQAVGSAHSLRTIPEACARLEGAFTGDAAEPYRFAAVRTRANCQPRARFVDAARADPGVANGWILNDLIRVPSAACAGQQAVVRVWRKPAAASPPDLDAQGRSRIYLQDSKQTAGAARDRVPMFAAEMTVEGRACAQE
ncbi:hypothetical protein FKV24_002535 [Lysobacter maris]|uniref:Uncharacterized protein n=1 Tax=Marilutibacter maris TaxID=1605891 RepID=A0A508BBU6_9GAMM|nr:hypothetical protein [Lysobacter maris]KAB8198344.1 hypothetical protein FKV24_002535 [Lysobacter maris]